MSLVVREEGSVPIPEDLAEEFGVHKGSSVEGEQTEDDRLALHTHSSRAEAARKLLGLGEAWLKPGESGVESFLKWRQEERELDETY